MTPETKMLVLFFVAMIGLLIYAVGRIVSTWCDHHISRHDLIVESKRRRLDYLRAVAEREQELHAEEAEGNASVMIEPAEPEELAQAA